MSPILILTSASSKGEDGGGGKGRLGTVSALMSKLWQLRLRRRNLEFVLSGLSPKMKPSVCSERLESLLLQVYSPINLST